MTNPGQDDLAEIVGKHISDTERDRFSGAVLKGGLPEMPVRDTLPTASADFAYRSVVLRDTPDVQYQCMRLADGTWAWCEVAGSQHNFFNGSFRESFDALVTSDGATITMSLEQSGGGDLTMQFSDGQEVFDCTPADTIALTAGTDASPQTNYIYILQSDSTRALTKSTSAFPSTEHIKIGFFLVPSATYVQNQGVYINQNWNDHSEGTNNMGHMLHIAERSRRDGAYWFSGVAGNGTDDYLTPTASNVELKSTSGVIMQMHSHTFPAFDTSGGDEALVVNWNGDSYHNITNLFDITADSGGNAIGANKYFNLTIWGVANKTGQTEQMMVNLPSGFYNTQAGAEADGSGYDDFTMPREFNIDSSTGFLIARITIKMAATWVVSSTVDLRGSTPQTATGGASSSASEFADNVFTVYDNTDNTKEVQLSVGGLTTATTRTLTVQDADGTLAYTADVVSTHGGLSGVTSDQHHAEAHSLSSHSSEAHSELSGVGINDHHEQFGSSDELTIASGVISITDQSAVAFHLVDTQSDASSDDLDTISNASSTGQVLVIKPASAARTVVAKDGAGNLNLAGDFSMDNSEDTLMLIYFAAAGSWFELSRSNNGA